MSENNKKPQSVQFVYDLPPEGSGNWIEFGGELRMGDIWDIADAEETGDTRVLAKKLPRIVVAWQLLDSEDQAVLTDEEEVLDLHNPEHYASLTLSQYRAVAEAAGEYIRALADVGN